MKIKTFRDTIKHESFESLQARLDTIRRELFTARISKVTAHVKDYSQFKKARRDIARIMTVIQQKNGL